MNRNIHFIPIFFRYKCCGWILFAIKLNEMRGIRATAFFQRHCFLPNKNYSSTINMLKTNKISRRIRLGTGHRFFVHLNETPEMFHTHTQIFPGQDDGRYCAGYASGSSISDFLINSTRPHSQFGRCAALQLVERLSLTEVSLSSCAWLRYRVYARACVCVCAVLRIAIVRHHASRLKKKFQWLLGHRRCRQTITFYDAHWAFPPNKRPPLHLWVTLWRQARLLHIRRNSTNFLLNETSNVQNFNWIFSEWQKDIVCIDNIKMNEVCCGRCSRSGHKIAMSDVCARWLWFNVEAFNSLATNRVWLESGSMMLMQVYSSISVRSLLVTLQPEKSSIIAPKI